VPEPQLDLDWAAYADEIARRISTIRRQRGVSQTELAAATGLSRTQIQNIERSENTTIHSLFVIAQALGVPPKLFIPDGIPLANYRQMLDTNWSTIEFAISDEISSHPMPASTRASQYVKPALSPLNWISEQPKVEA